MYHINDAACVYRLCSYYCRLLQYDWDYFVYYSGCVFDNTTSVGNCAYFNIQFLSRCFMVEDCYFDISWSSSVYPLDYASSSICNINSFYVNSTVTGNVTDSDINGGLFEFWLHDSNLDITITDNFGGFMGPINASF